MTATSSATVAVTTASSAAAPATGHATVAALAREWAQRAPTQVAMREKQFGIWQELRWGEVWEAIEDAAHALIALGVECGDRVSIHSEDRPEWVFLDLATVAARGTTVGLYPTNPTKEVAYILTDCGATIHFAEDQEQVDKVLALDRSEVPDLRTIIYAEPRGLVGIDDDRLVSWTEFLEIGRQHKLHHRTALADRMMAARADDIMTLVYTSGTTGPPKGAMLTNANASFYIDVIVGSKDRMAGGPPTPRDEILTYLPLCHVAERVLSTWTSVSTGAILNFAESIESVNENLREIQPTLFFAVPRIWEKLYSSAMIRSGNATPFKRLVLKLGLAMGRKIGKIKIANHGEHTLASRALYAVGWVLLFRSFRERLGLRRVRHAVSGAAPIAPEVLEFFIGLGVPVYESYAMTENTAVATTNFVGRMRLGTVGEPYPGTGIRIDADTGEIQCNHGGVFAGYWGNPEKTLEAMTSDGWLRTGDVGEWVDGTHIRIIDRIKDIIITAGGKNISPSEIENSLKVSPFIREAMVIGDAKPYLIALIGIELETVSEWALREGIPYTTYRDLSEKPEVVQLIAGAVAEANAKFARVENIRKFRLIPKELQHEDGEVTATQKIKRTAMTNMFKDLVEEMYR